MGLSKKTFLYSIILAAGMVAFITGYFVFMLPSLYVNYVTESNFNAAVDIHKGFMEQRSYDHLAVKNPSATYTLEIPKEGNSFFIMGKFFQMDVAIQDPDLQSLFHQLRTMMHNMEAAASSKALSETDSSGTDSSGTDSSNTDSLDTDFSNNNFFENGCFDEESLSSILGTLKEKFVNQQTQDSPVKVEIMHKENEGVYHQEYTKVHTISDQFIVYETGVSDENYGYTTYIVIESADNAYFFTVLPAMTPRMEEITPVVLGSMPMIIAVVFLLVLLSSRYFSGKIVHPIIRLANFAKSVRLGSAGFEANFTLKSKDEIGDLANALQLLYQKLEQNYQELAQKNQHLEEENTRQEVFLRATSHQLKTPIAAALLLVESMINEIGKYKNTKEFLPEVKKQLLSMRKIVEDVLHLNYHTAQIEQEPLSIDALMQELLHSYAVQITDKQLTVDLKGSGTLTSDREILKKILDNLLSNAIQYTPKGEHISINIEETALYLQNFGVNIDNSLLPNIFEPFVSSNESQKGKGLGLYVAAYYSRLLGFPLYVENKHTDTLEYFVQSKLVYNPKK